MTTSSAAPVEKRVDTLRRAAAAMRKTAFLPNPYAVADLLEEFARLDDQGIHPPTSVVTLAKRYLGEAS